jgi:pimeloyl-ACP methyl ester carboxylesterase
MSAFRRVELPSQACVLPAFFPLTGTEERSLLTRRKHKSRRCPQEAGLHRWMRLWLGSTLIAGLLQVAVAQTAPSPGSEIREQAVTFHVGSVRLAGTLLRPAQKGPVPGIVLLAGSGPGPRSHLRLFAERFAKDGCAALIFDKRGSGESEGSWTEESLDDLADDVLAAVAFLKSQPEINPQRVGVWGISQAGWVIPHAAGRAPDAFAFAIVITGGGVKPLEVEIQDYSAALDHADSSLEGEALVQGPELRPRDADRSCACEMGLGARL